MEKLIKVHMKKHIFTDRKYEIVIEDVENLGSFLEVEYKQQSQNKNPIEIKSDIEKFIAGLGFQTSRSADGGKPEQLLQKMHGKLSD